MTSRFANFLFPKISLFQLLSYLPRQVFLTQGLGSQGLNKGLTATICRNGIFNAVYFGFYHSVKGFLPELEVDFHFQKQHTSINLHLVQSMVFKICFYVSFVYFQIIYEISSSCSQVYTTDSLNYLCSCCFVLKPKLFITQWFKIAKKTHLQRPDFTNFPRGFLGQLSSLGGVFHIPPPHRKKEAVEV